MTITELTEPDEGKRILGIWDLRVSPVSLGGLLILIEELQMQCVIHKTHFADICVVGDAAHLLPIRGARADGGSVTLLDSAVCKDSALLSVLLDMEGVGVCYLCDTIPALRDFVRASPYSYVTWPTLNEEGLVSHRYASTMFAQKFYRENGFIPHLSCKAEFIRWAMQLVERYVIPCVSVVVHLKNNRNEQGCSNADSDAWLTFFEVCHQQYDVMFILIGNEDIDQRVRKLPNILVVRDFGSNLSRDLALIQTASIFMGMASGPCNMALFSDIPYVIYKNPDHHAKQMTLELDKGNRFPFATPSQKVLLALETRENLTSEFAHLYSQIDRQDWESRLASLR